MQNYITPSSDISLIPLMWLCAGMQPLNGSHEQKHQWKKCVHTVDINTKRDKVRPGMHIRIPLLSCGLCHMIHQELRWFMFAVCTGDQPLVPMIQLSDPQLS